ncbi:MAG: hypothetical protein ACRCS3_04600 [Paracoccaceae bacterium]
MVGKATLTGAAGEHLVMSRLLSRGFIAALAPQGVPNLDIVVTSVGGERLCNLQVKTRWNKGSDGGWHMSKKHEHIESEHMFYCFVDFGISAESDAVVFVVPSGLVSKLVRESYSAWFGRPGKNNVAHKETDFRRFLPNYEKDFGKDTEYGPGWLEKYREAWGSLPLLASNLTQASPS